MRMGANELVLRYEALESERENLDGQLELLERFVLPGKGRFFQEGNDSEESIDWRHREVYDGTAYNALVLLASNVHSALTSPAATWFELSFREAELNDDKESSEWLEDSAERMRAAFGDSNFNLEVNEFYQDGAGFGTSVILHNEVEGQLSAWNGHQFKAEMLRGCYFEENMDGKVTAIFIKRSYTAMQLVLKFGKDALPESIRQKADAPGVSSTDKYEDAIYCLYLDPDRKDADVRSILPVASRPYVGQWVLTEGRHMMGEEQGFYELPGYVLRWQRTAGSKYGHCPGMIALGDILTLQESVEAVRTATEKTVDPPMKHTRRGIIGDVDISGGGLTAVRSMSDLAPLMPPGAYRPEVGWMDIKDLRARIERYFFVDQLQLKDSPQMTATETQVRFEMMQRLLGPTIGRIQSDFLDPLIERSFWMMFRKGALRDMPEMVRESSAELDIEYVGPLARAQKMQGVVAVERWLAGLERMAKTKPEVLDMPDFDEITKHLASILGVPAKLIRSSTDVAKLREARQKAQAQAQSLQAAQGAASAAKDLGQSGLMDQMGQMGQGQPGSGAPGELPEMPGALEAVA